jgi:type IV secretory pathway protease TraF
MNFKYRSFLQTRSKILKMAIIVSVVSSIFFKVLFSKITLVRTPSVKYRFFWTNQIKKENIEKNKYVRIITDKIKSDLCKQQKITDGKCLVVKRVGCPGGSYLMQQGSDFYCDGEKISQALKGNKSFKFNGIIPVGKYFLIGDHKYSYDSKAVGFFNEEEINAILVPLF